MNKNDPKARKSPPTKSRTRLTVGVLAAFVVLAGLATWQLDPKRFARFGGELFGKHGGKAAEQARRSSAQAESSSEALERYRVGDVFTYALTTEGAVDVDEGGRLYHMQADGEWTLRVLEVKPRRVLWAASLEGARLVSSQRMKDGEEQFKLIERALGEPVFFALDAQGRVSEVRYAADTPRPAIDVMRSVLALSQVVGPTKPDAQRWTAIEADASGRYTAEYSRTATNQWKKRKLQYTEVVASSVTSSVKLDVLSSEGEIVLDANGVLQSEQIRDSVRSVAQLMPEMKSTTMLSLTRKKHTVELAPVAALLDQAAKMQSYALYEGPINKDDQMAVDQAKIRGRNLNDFLLEFEALPPHAEQSDDQRARDRRSFVELAALLRTDDKAVDQALAAIVGGSGVGSILWDALANAGTPRAQAALRQLIDDPQFKDEEHRTQLIGLSFVNEATDDTIKFLTARMSDPLHGQQARFGLGTAVNHLHGTDPKKAQKSYAVLVDNLRAAKSEQDKSDFLLAIGNSALPEAKPLIESYLGDEDFAVRGAAAQALRFMPGDDVAVTLLNLIKDDPSSFVRAQALDSASDHRPTQALLDQVFDTALGDESDMARKKAMETIMLWRAKYPPVEEAFAAFEAKALDQSAP